MAICLTAKDYFALLLLAMGLIVANAAEATRAEGPTGKKGPRGDQGIVGKIGASGRIGLPGPRGGGGAKGDAGAVGPDAPVHMVGDSYQGGIIFWVEPDGQHGLIAASGLKRLIKSRVIPIFWG